MARNFDYPMPQEGRMAKSYLWSIEQDARQLRKQLEDGDDLPGWVQAKIVTAQDRMQTVNRYLSHKIARAEARANPGCGCGCNSCGGVAKTNPAAGGGMGAILIILGSVGALYALDHVRK